MSKSVEFTNPDNLPVENVTLMVKNAGVVQEVQALDPYWVDSRLLRLYERPPSGTELVLGAVEVWKAKMEVYLADLKWLLSLEHHRFWSNVLYHKQCMDSLVSFLQEADPPYLPTHDSRDVQKLYGEIRRFVLIVFSRLITNKESKSQWMTKEHMASLIYENFIFTIPIIWDICLVYGADNGQHVSRLLTSIYTLQPNYDNDTLTALGFVNEAFKYIILQVNKDYDSVDPPNLPETFKGFSEIRRPSNSKNPETLTYSILKDLIIHLLDIAMTVRIFAEAYSGSVKLFKKCNFVLSIVQIYEYGIPLLYEKLEELRVSNTANFVEVHGYIDSARAELIDLFREILAKYKNAILNGEGNVANHVEDFLTVMMDGLSEKLFIRDYQACYPVHEDLEMLMQAYPHIDTVKTDFILQAIYSNQDEPVPENLYSNHRQEIQNGHIETTDNSNSNTPTDDELPDNVKMESLISEVKDVLPELGDGFVLKCLEHYGFSAERVINSILEDNLAETLRGLDRSLPIIPEDPLDKKFLETGIARLNVFDGDEFDVMTRDDVDLSRIHLGKKRDKYKDFSDMLDDKTEVKKRLDIYNKYNLICDDEEGLYSDEYDDTYDSDGVVPRADLTEDMQRPLVTPRVLRRAHEEEESEEESDEEEQPSASTSKNRMDFCTNPEEIRARREANFQARRGKGHRPPPPKNADVVGKARGQGQEKEVLANRDRKEKHKSSRANHNRRQGAQWKRTQGMMPS